jgi:hypothetical protein
MSSHWQEKQPYPVQAMGYSTCVCSGETMEFSKDKVVSRLGVYCTCYTTIRGIIIFMNTCLKAHLGRCDVLLKEESLWLLMQKPRHENCHWLFIRFILTDWAVSFTQSWFQCRPHQYKMTITRQSARYCFVLPLIQQSVTEKRFHILLLLTHSFSKTILPLQSDSCKDQYSFCLYPNWFTLSYSSPPSSILPSESDPFSVLFFSYF